MVFRRPIPRRALAAAALGLLYSFLVLPSPGTVVGVSLLGVAWFLLSIGLLFLRTLSYHAYMVWGLIWVVFKGVQIYRAGFALAPILLDVVLPATSVVLLLTSPYLHWAQAARAADDGAAE